MKHLRSTILLFLYGLITAFAVLTNHPDSKEPSVAVMAYYVPEKEYKPEELPLHQLTHIIFSFTHVIDGKMQFRNKEDGKKLEQLVFKAIRNRSF